VKQKAAFRRFISISCLTRPAPVRILKAALGGRKSLVPLVGGFCGRERRWAFAAGANEPSAIEKCEQEQVIFSS
jgi:hypothetical protein